MQSRSLFGLVSLRVERLSPLSLRDHLHGARSAERLHLQDDLSIKELFSLKGTFLISVQWEQKREKEKIKEKASARKSSFVGEVFLDGRKGFSEIRQHQKEREREKRKSETLDSSSSSLHLTRRCRSLCTLTMPFSSLRWRSRSLF